MELLLLIVHSPVTLNVAPRPSNMAFCDTAAAAAALMAVCAVGVVASTLGSAPNIYGDI